MTYEPQAGLTLEQETACIVDAFDVARALTVDLPEDSEQLTPVQKLAISYGMLAHRYAWTQQERRSRCGYCVSAVGGDEAAWDAVEVRTFAAAHAHALSCPHNPLVRELAEARARIAELHDQLASRAVALSAPDPVHERNGKWAASSHEELWRDGETFETREEAIAYAEAEFVDDDRFWTGRIKMLAPSDLADAISGSFLLDQIGEHLHDILGEAADDHPDLSELDQQELESVVGAAITAFFASDDRMPELWAIDDVRRHVVVRGAK